MPIKAILFDMDGLLVDSEPLLCKSVIFAFKKQGLKLRQSEFYRHWTKLGKGGKEYADENKLIFNLKKYRLDKANLYLSLIKTKISAKPGVIEKVKTLSKYYSLAVVSSSPIEFIKPILTKIGLSTKFKLIISSELVRNKKPHPEPFLLAAKLLRISPNECLVLEDAEKGVLSGKRAGMKVVAIPTKWTKDNDFSKADRIIKSIKKLDKEIIG